MLNIDLRLMNFLLLLDNIVEVGFVFSLVVFLFFVFLLVLVKVVLKKKENGGVKVMFVVNLIFE